jgi:uncharacterized protein
MTLKGVVTDVAAFGAFVDIGVHRMAWSTSPPCTTSAPKPAQRGQGRADRDGESAGTGKKRKRIALTMRLTDAVGQAGRT